MSSLKGVQAYKSAESEALVESDDPHILIGVLFDELIRRMQGYRHWASSGHEELEKRSEHYARSLSILHSLQSCLDFDNGGEIADNLFRIYEYARQQLLASFRTKEFEGMDTAIHCLIEIRDSWRAMPLDELSK
jgi:flagellar protein FliS